MTTIGSVVVCVWVYVALACHDFVDVKFVHYFQKVGEVVCSDMRMRMRMRVISGRCV